ncbi:hypothetical protein LXL04_007932 [Taraxacum kok-saghyz]
MTLGVEFNVKFHTYRWEHMNYTSQAFVVDEELDDCDANKSSSQQAKLPFDVFLYDICHPLFTMTIKLVMGKPLEKKGSEFLKHAIIFTRLVPDCDRAMRGGIAPSRATIVR